MRQFLVGNQGARVPAIRRALATLVLAAGVMFSHDARASIVLGDHLGTFSGNDSEASLLAELGLVVTQLAKVESPATSSGGLTLSEIVFNSDVPPEPISGQWQFSGEGLVDLIVVKAGPNYAVFQFTDINTSNMRNIGLWSTALLDNKGMSHISAYQISAVPLPAALPLLGSAFATLGFLGWRRKRTERSKAAIA